MINTAIGDLARHFVLQNSSHRLKSTMDVLTQEMTSGRVADLGQRVGGNMVPIHHIENRLRILNEYKQTTVQTMLQADAIQETLGGLQAINQRTSNELIVAMQTPSPSITASRARDAAISLTSVVAHLNISSAGIHPFSGTATDTAPLISSAEIMTELKTLTAGLTTPLEIEDAVSDWFDAPAGGGGFLDIAYRGDIGTARATRVSETETAVFDIDATAAPIRTLMKGLAMAALVDEGALSGQPEDQHDLMRRANRRLLNNQSDLIALSARNGLVQQRTDQAQAANSAALSSFEIARNDITSADPFATATALNEVQNQLQMLYSITSRLQGLKLVNFLR